MIIVLRFSTLYYCCLNDKFFPTAFKDCVGIFTHGVQMGERSGGRLEKACLLLALRS